MATTMDGTSLQWWSAFSAPGSPVCIASSTSEEDMSVEIYLDGENIIGLIINDGTGRRKALGLIPAEMLSEDD